MKNMMDTCDVCEKLKLKTDGTTGTCDLNDHIVFICNECTETTRVPCRCCGKVGDFLEEGVCTDCQE